jgi:hypothetical protein
VQRSHRIRALHQDSQDAWNEMYALCRELVTCGGDGFVKIFMVTASGDLGLSLRSIPLRQGDAEAGVPAPLARSLAVHDSGCMTVGTAACDIWQVSPAGQAETIIFGHRSDVIGLAMNPKPEFSHIFATCSDSCKVAVWSLVTHKVSTAPITLTTFLFHQGPLVSL